MEQEEETATRNPGKQDAVAAGSHAPVGAAAEHLRAVAERVRASFPRPIEGRELVLIDVDPRHLHAFWTLPPALVEQARRSLGSGGGELPMVLRIAEADAAGTAHAPFDVEIVGLQGQCYVDIWGEARRYAGELGLRKRDGALLSLAASEPLELPRLGPAETAVSAAPALAAGHRPLLPPAAVPEIAESTLPAAKSTPPPAAAEALPEPVRHPFPLPPTEASDFDPQLLHATVGAPAGGTASVASGGPDGGADAPSRARQALSDGPPPLPTVPLGPPACLTEPPAAVDVPEPIHHPFPLPPTEAGEYVPELVGGFLSPEAASPAAVPSGPEFAGERSAPAAEAPPSPSSDEPLPLPLENVLSLSSFVLGQEQVDFEINAELHIFGRVRPGSQLQLFGRKVSLRPDGTFSITRPLPNGALVLSSLLVNSNGDGESH